MGEEPEKCCAYCANLEFWDCPADHWWCKKNPDCPCNGSETPDYENSCDDWAESAEVRP